MIAPAEAMLKHSLQPVPHTLDRLFESVGDHWCGHAPIGGQHLLRPVITRLHSERNRRGITPRKTRGVRSARSAHECPPDDHQLSVREKKGIFSSCDEEIHGIFTRDSCEIQAKFRGYESGTTRRAMGRRRENVVESEAHSLDVRCSIIRRAGQQRLHLKASVTHSFPE